MLPDPFLNTCNSIKIVIYLLALTTKVIIKFLKKYS
jgi:hypothetical protein